MYEPRGPFFMHTCMPESCFKVTNLRPETTWSFPPILLCALNVDII